MKTTNKVFKNCIMCNEVFEDKTRPKNKKTCSRKCADEARKARQRKQYRIENPKKPTDREIYYYDHHEYSFWLDDKKFDHQSWKVANPKSTENIEYIIAAKERYDLIGGRRKGVATVEYDGDEKANARTYVQFVDHDHKEPSEVVSYTMTPEELAEYRRNKVK